MRMLLLLVVSLYTSRIVLATLGIEDYGVYNVVGGVVTMFMFLNAAMGNSSHRYIAFALGKGDEKELHDVVCATCMVHWILAGVIFILAETIGLWFLHYKLVIPNGRMVAAEWVFQFSVIACMVNIISVPYNAMIIAHEKMGAFAFISIMDAVLKLLIVYVIQITEHDKLIFYAAFVLCVNILDRLIYQVYCKRRFPESKNIRFKNYPQLKEMISFAGWSLIGNLIYMGYTQGINIMLNIFFGPVVNAARGIAHQVESAVKGFVTNFQTAANPQITKSYAVQDFNRMHSLIFMSSKFSYCLLLILVLPIIIEADTVLNLWLVEVPEHTIAFLRITLLSLLIGSLENPIGTANNATGKIKKYQIVVACFNVLIILLSYVLLRLGYQPESVFIVQLGITVIVQFVKVYLVKGPIHLSMREYLKRIIMPLCFTTIASVLLPIIVCLFLKDGIIRLCIVGVISVLSVLIVSYCVALNGDERNVVKAYLITAWQKLSKEKIQKK